MTKLVYIKPVKAGLTIICVGAYFLIICLSIRIYKADVNYKKARALFTSGQSVAGLEKINKAINYNPYEPSYYRERAKLYLSTTVTQEYLAKQKLKELAYNNLNRSIDLNPNNLASIRNAIPNYYFLTVEDLANPEGANNIDETYYKDVVKILEETKKTYPADLGVQILIASYENKLGLKNEKKETLEAIEILRPDVLEWHPKLLLLKN